VVSSTLLLTRDQVLTSNLGPVGVVGGILAPRMPHGTARAPHVRLCGQSTTHTERVVKKIEKFFFCPFSSLFPPCPRERSPQSKTNFFSTKKII
jgi:hypothetical protein